MVDFCYFLQASTWLQTLICTSDSNPEGFCPAWFKGNYALSHGPIAIAIVAWQNSLVFHSADKVCDVNDIDDIGQQSQLSCLQVTSFALHIMPPLLNYLLRWEPRTQHWNNPGSGSGSLALSKIHSSDMTWTDQFYYPMIFYSCWQIFFIIVQMTILDRDRSLTTSLRHLVKDEKNPSTKLGYYLAYRFGEFKQNYNCIKGKQTMLLLFWRHTALFFYYAWNPNNNLAKIIYIFRVQKTRRKAGPLCHVDDFDVCLFPIPVYFILPGPNIFILQLRNLEHDLPWHPGDQCRLEGGHLLHPDLQPEVQLEVRESRNQCSQ